MLKSVMQRKAEEFFDLPPARCIGKNYKIIDYLGYGWEGEVYKVEEIDTGIMQAAKLFYQNHHKEKARHIQYAKKLHRLKTCPIIIQYHHKDSAYIKNRKVDFLVSEYVDGEVLSQYLDKQKRKKIELFESLQIFYNLVKGIEHIHLLGEYHGDIHTDNIIINRKGLKFDVRLIDILHLGNATAAMRQEDVYSLINVLFELIGGQKYYSNCHANIKNIILGRKKKLIQNKFKTASQLRVYLDNLVWG